MADNQTTLLVAPEISRAKLQRELDQFARQSVVYRQRGYWIVRADDLDVYVAFAARVRLHPFIPQLALTVVTAYIKFNFQNYDLWAPSATFMDMFSDTPAAAVMVQALQRVDGTDRNLLVAGHPVTGQPFLCMRGIREYHTHPQHSGDQWALYRRETSLTSLCERIWELMARNVTGVKLDYSIGMAQASMGLNLLQENIVEHHSQLELLQSPVPEQIGG